MKRSLFAVVLALLLATAANGNAQTAQAKKPQAKLTPQAKTQVVEDKPESRGYFSWKHYGVNPLAPDEYIEAPEGVDTTDKSQIYNIIMNSKGYERANKAVRTGMAASFFGSPLYPVPDKFWNDVIQSAQEGMDEVCVQNGQRAGDYSLSFGSKLDKAGNTHSYSEGPYPVNETGGTICGWRLRKQVHLDGGSFAGEWVRPIIYRQCRNTTGFRAEALVPIIAPPAVTIQQVTTPPPSPQPPQPSSPPALVAAHEELGNSQRYAITVGLTYNLGKVQSSYSGAAAPGTGDAAQRNMFRALAPVFRLEPTGSGPFASGNATFLDTTGKKEFLDGWTTKIRDTDKTRDRRYEFAGGWQFGFRGVGLAPFVGYQSFCLCEKYTAQGADTVTERSYKGLIAGAQMMFAQDSSRPKWTVRLRGTYAPSMTRTAWTHQTYQSIDFPKVSHPDAHASSLGLRPEAEVRLWGPILGTVGYDFLHISSQRTNTFAASESVNVHTLTFGVGIRFGR
jgi:hypothetical protein